MSLLYQEDDDENWSDPDSDPESPPVPRWKRLLIFIKIVILLLLWCYFSVILILWPVQNLDTSVVVVLPNETTARWLWTHSAVAITLWGPIDSRLTRYPKHTENVSMVGVRMQWLNTTTNQTSNHTATWNVYLEEDLESMLAVTKLFELLDVGRSDLQALVTFKGKCRHPVAFLMVTDPTPMGESQLLYAILLVLGLYILIVFELTDPTFGLLLITTAGIAVLSERGDRPPLTEIIGWIDFDPLMLLVGMMIIVGIMSGTGIFDWLVILAYRLSKGHPWLLVFFLGLLTALLSSVLDNVMIVSLVVPGVVRLCEAINVQTALVILVVIMYANIGGALTPVGDLPNMIITTHLAVAFEDFTLHMLPGVLGSLLIGMPFIYLTMRDKLYQLEGQQMIVTEEDETSPPIRKRQSSDPTRPTYDYFETLAYLRANYGIRDRPLLAKSLIAAAFVLIGFVMASQPFMPGASEGWLALLGAFLLIILAKLDHTREVLRMVDWSVLLFLSAQYVFATVLDRLGLINWLSDHLVVVIGSVDKRHQMKVAIILILWISGFASALVGNVPVTSLMLKVIIEISASDLDIPLSPLIWALSHGACFGAIGSLFGASAYMIGAILVRQFGRISVLEFSLYGFPMMIASLAVASAYLLIAHTVYEWH